MFSRKKSGKKSSNEIQDKYNALGKSQAVIEFDLDGNILIANENFLGAMGYTLPEVQGKHHSIFVDSGYAQSEEYRAFWSKLRRGEYDSKEYRRQAKCGRDVWIQASYNPILDVDGKPYKVVKFATEVTHQKMTSADYRGQIDAIGKSQAVIEFNLDGTIINANKNFLNAVGYDLEEVKGKHHSIFADPSYAQSDAYREFWAKLRRGEYDAGEYKRLGKGGREIWIQASYNPIMDMNGTPFKVVKYASDVTREKLSNADFKGQIDAISKVQAVIHFNLDGTIIQANDLFLGAVGYTLAEIEGKHHSIFVEPEYAKSSEYRQFWENLRAGRNDASVYKRLGRGGKAIWMRASYNPILDMNGKPFKVVKFASDITEIIRLTEEANGNVQSVAAATEEMSSSIAEISKNMSMSKQAVDSIVAKTTSSGEASERLMENVKAMESIVTLISDIAGQVNLLALNATIEAARAGDAGKGFAVVASEVKNLANQTAVATDQIAKEISTVQGISSEVAKSVKEIVEGASAVDQYVSSVASAIEEQNAVTQEISGNSQRASVAVDQIGVCVKRG